MNNISQHGMSHVSNLEHKSKLLSILCGLFITFLAKHDFEVIYI